MFLECLAAGYGGRGGPYRSVAVSPVFRETVAFVHGDKHRSATAYRIDHDVHLTGHTLPFGLSSNEEAATGETVRRLMTGRGTFWHDPQKNIVLQRT